MSTFALTIRTPTGVVFAGDAETLRAEDESGWFGIQPQRAPLVATLPPGLLLFVDEAGEAFVALSEGLLTFADARCTVLVREATMSRSLDDVAEALAARWEARNARARVHRDVLHALAHQALVRMLDEVRA